MRLTSYELVTAGRACPVPKQGVSVVELSLLTVGIWIARVPERASA